MVLLDLPNPTSGPPTRALLFEISTLGCSLDVSISRE